MAPRANLRAPKPLQVKAESSLICPAAHPVWQLFMSTCRYFEFKHLVHLSAAEQVEQSAMTVQALHINVSLNSLEAQVVEQDFESLVVTEFAAQVAQLMGGVVEITPDPALQVRQSLDVADVQETHKSEAVPVAHGQMTAVERVRARMAIATNFMITYF